MSRAILGKTLWSANPKITTCRNRDNNLRIDKILVYIMRENANFFLTENVYVYLRTGLAT